MTTATQIYQRINITLPQQTLELLDRITDKGDRSRVISDAVEHYVADVGTKNLRKQLKEGALMRAQRDLAIAEEWFHIDEKIWSHQK